jgi:membrane fusion protein, multidrug efflux system
MKPSGSRDGVFLVRLSHLILTSAALGAGLCAACGCNRQEAQAAPTMPPPLVTTSVARAQDVPVYLDEIGKCTARESVTVTPQVAGIITERHFEDGADLTKGQLLFTIDPRPFKAQLDAAKAQLAQSKAAEQFAKLELDRYAAVANTRAISKSDYDTKQNAYDVAAAMVAVAQAAVESATLNLGYCQIRSPIAGRAGARLVDAGNVVKSNEGALVLIQRLDPIYADFTVTERDLPNVQREMAKGTLKTLVRLPGDAVTDSRTGDLAFLDNAVQDGTGTVKLRATVSNADHHFWPGQFVDVKLILSTLQDAVLIPGEAAQISQQGPFVYVVRANNTADLRPVILGQRQGTDIVVTRGVSRAERVIVTGQLAVQPNGPIREQPPMTMPPARAPGAAEAPGAAGAPGASSATSPTTREGVKS